MIEKKARQISRGLLEAMAKVLVRLGLSPNTVTILSFLVGLVGVYFLAEKQLAPALVLLLVSGLLDTLDGSVARLTNKSSKWGAFLDSTLDKIIEIAIFVGIGFYDQTLWLWCMLGIGIMMLSSYTNKHISALNIKETDNRPFFYVYSFADRIERMILMFLAIALPMFMKEIIIFYILLVGISFLQRMSVARNLLKSA